MTSNSETAKRIYINEAELEWECFDKLPAELRACLREALQDYSAEQVYEDYRNRLSASRNSDTIDSFFGFAPKPDPVRDVKAQIARLDVSHGAEYRAEMRSQRIRIRG